MSRETRLKRTIRREVERQQKNSKPVKPPLRARFWKWLAYVVPLIISLIALWPRISVTVSDPVDPDQPFSSSVTITNTGYMPLRAVLPDLGILRIASTDGAEMRSPGEDYSLMRPRKWGPRDLGLDQQLTFALNEITYTLPNRLGLADIAIVVEFRIPLVPITWKRIYPRTATKQSNGKFYWYATVGQVN